MRPPGGRLRGGECADPVPVLRLQLLHDRGLAEQRVGVGRGEDLQRGGEAPVHVAFRGELADRGLARDHPGGVLPEGGHRGRRFRAGLGELDPQPVVLLAQHVDLVPEALGLSHQAGQAGLRAAHGRAARGGGQYQGGHRGHPADRRDLTPGAVPEPGAAPPPCLGRKSRCEPAFHELSSLFPPAGLADGFGPEEPYRRTLRCARSRIHPGNTGPRLSGRVLAAQKLGGRAALWGLKCSTVTAMQINGSPGAWWPEQQNPSRVVVAWPADCLAAASARLTRCAPAVSGAGKRRFPVSGAEAFVQVSDPAPGREIEPRSGRDGPPGPSGRL